jgi:hypothetical protein
MNSEALSMRDPHQLSSQFASPYRALCSDFAGIPAVAAQDLFAQQHSFGRARSLAARLYCGPMMLADFAAQRTVEVRECL